MIAGYCLLFFIGRCLFFHVIDVVFVRRVLIALRVHHRFIVLFVHCCYVDGLFWPEIWCVLWALSAGRWALGARRWALSAGRWALGAGPVFTLLCQCCGDVCNQQLVSGDFVYDTL